MTHKFSLLKRTSSKVFISAFLLGCLLLAGCSSTRSPYRPAMKHKKRNCDCSRWGYVPVLEKPATKPYAC